METRSTKWLSFGARERVAFLTTKTSLSKTKILKETLEESFQATAKSNVLKTSGEICWFPPSWLCSSLPCSLFLESSSDIQIVQCVFVWPNASLSSCPKMMSKTYFLSCLHHYLSLEVTLEKVQTPAWVSALHVQTLEDGQGQQLTLCRCCKIRRDLQFLCRIVELEGTFRNHLVRLSGRFRAKQNLKCIIEGIIQTLLEQWQEALPASFRPIIKWKLSLVLTKWQILWITQNGLSSVLQLSWWRVFVVTLNIPRISINFCNPHWKLTQSLAL